MFYNNYIIQKLEKYLSFNNEQFKYFLIIVATTQTIYSVVALREVLYEPFRAVLGTSNAVLGSLFGLIGFVQIFGYLLFGWLQDKMNIRYLLTFDLLGYAISTLVMANVPHLPFGGLVTIFILFGLFGDAIYWPTIQKSIKGLASSDKQATVFGFMETWRGISGIILNSLAIIVFTILGSSIFGMRFVMTFNSLLMIGVALIVYFKLPNDFLKHKQKEKQVKRSSLGTIIKCMKDPVVLLTGIGASCIYAVFSAVTTYFVPFLQHIYALPIAFVGIFGIVNGQVTRMIASPVSGTVSDKRFKTSALWMALCYSFIAILFGIILLMPHNKKLLIILIPLILLVSVICYFIRGVYYAPIGEAKIEDDYSATAMSIASFIGYSPSFWAFTLFGYLLDKYKGYESYKYIFIILLILSIAGLLANLLNHQLILKRRSQSNK